MQTVKTYIESGQACLGIELGSTRIKAVLINQQGHILASGSSNWENQLENGIWTYSLHKIWKGLQHAYLSLTQEIEQKYQTTLHKLSAIGISAMMHGYLPFNKDGELLVPFRTWRNNITQQSAEKLSALFQHNIPQRWSIAHLYQAILNNEQHLTEIDFITTLAGYVHWQLTGKKVLGIGDASGMFPISDETLTYDQNMLEKFNNLVKGKYFNWTLENLLPQVMKAGENAGYLTAQGAKLLDPTGNLQANIPLCPPEGDAGTGMIATNSIQPNTGNISAGTSAFAMIVLDKPLSKNYPELDIVTTPDGKLVAMAHANNCSSDINAWVNIFQETLQLFKLNITPEDLYETLFTHALTGQADCGNLISYGFYSGEHNLELDSGCPLFIHPTNSQFNLANFMLVHLYSAFATMKLGLDILLEQEQLQIKQILAHGGIFKTKHIAQKILSSALNIPIATLETAGEGGAWGMALLANFLGKNQSLSEYLSQQIFSNTEHHLIKPDENLHKGYHQFMQNYQKGIAVVQTAINHIK